MEIPSGCLTAVSTDCRIVIADKQRGFVAGELKPEDAKRFLKTGTGTNEVPTVRSLGLFLWRVDYGSMN